MFGGNNDEGFAVRSEIGNRFAIKVGGNSQLISATSNVKEVGQWYNVAMVLDQSKDTVY